MTINKTGIQWTDFTANPIRFRNRETGEAITVRRKRGVGIHGARVMTHTTTDLSPERLDELAQWIEQPGHHPGRGESRALIAMARAKQAAERERDALREVLRLIAEREPICDHDWAPCDAARAALAQPTDAGGA